MNSTIRSLNLVLDPIRTEICTSSETCGVATMKVQYQSETGQGKLGGCVSKTFCSNGNGCSLAIRQLPSGATSLECKVLYINNDLLSFCCFLCFIFFLHEFIRKKPYSGQNFALITNT